MLSKTNYDVNSAVNRFYELGLTGTSTNENSNIDKKTEALYK